MARPSVPVTAKVSGCGRSATRSTTRGRKQNRADNTEQPSIETGPTRWATLERAAGDRRPRHECEQRDERADDRQARSTGESHAEDDDVAGHVAGEHLVEPEVADRVDDAGGEGECEHESEVEAGRVISKSGAH
jgi:hypothetical protein